MPIYDYKCHNCERVVERKKSFYDTSAETCSECSAEMTRQLSVPSVQFKGSGFYSTDNGKK